MIVSELKEAAIAFPNQISEIKVRFDSSLPLIGIQHENGRYSSRDVPCRMVISEDSSLILIVGEE